MGNHLLVTIECLRSDHVSGLGYHKKTTPFLDRLIEDGIAFQNAYSVSTWTAPSLLSILTSSYPLRYKGKMGKARANIAQVFEENGFNTFAFGSSRIGKLRSCRQGFQNLRNKDCKMSERSEGFGISPDLPHLSWIRDFWRNNFVIHRVDETSRETVARLLRALEGEEGPFFAWIHMNDPHRPYLVGKESLSVFQFSQFRANFAAKKLSPQQKKKNLTFRDRVKFHIGKSLANKETMRNMVDLYDREIRLADRAIGMLFEGLRKEGKLHDTTFYITADHGEGFMEHGLLGHGPGERPRLYNELLQVPLVVWNAENQHERIRENVSLIDLSPTICDFASLSTPSHFAGKTLRRFFNGRKSASDGEIFCESSTIGWQRFAPEKAIIAVISGDYKYIWKSKGKDELYNLKEDSGEKENILNERKDMASKLRVKIDKHLEEVRKRGTKEEKERIKKSLSDLGAVRNREVN
ncbi:hypothetical protein AKJ45_00210 [candidate division MSBL1 archaeon SCGC-AAA261F19]|uniref:Sulfatase N-terminal domain-containing protein n=1 Tax=candidate division MSBL1 archaeon SCGC-AAA261F19 TaxID=1698275 RepID=A0A133VBK0_9EURY|nr:hypothetical protein AKJ45_00210 [candidate division MSBL1 archaeon SCGC-AAA261F19]